MTELESHYDILKVTRDAPDEVIRAAYRSLSQKLHPDKHGGAGEATRLMSRLNAAYSVLSDAEQRRRYDLQILQAGTPGAWPPSQDVGEAGMAVTDGRKGMLQRIHAFLGAPGGHTAAIVSGLVIVCFAIGFWLVWMERQQADLFDKLAAPVATRDVTRDVARDVANEAGHDAAPAQPVPPVPVATPKRAEPVAAEKPSDTKPPVASLPHTPATAPAPVPVAPAAPAAPPAPPKESEYERLTAMLKRMGLGLHKLDVPAQPQTAARAPAPVPAKPAAPEKPAAVADTNPAPAATPAPRSAAREAEPPRAPAASSASATAAATTAAAAASATDTAATPRQAVIADGHACAAPAYPKSAMRNGETGTVRLALLVASDGRVVESKVQKSSGSAVLDKAANKALSQCTFKVAGARAGGQGEPVWTTLDYVFALD